MMLEDFTVQGTQRFKELQDFLKMYLPDAYFCCPPVYYPETDAYAVLIRYSLCDANKLNELHSKWRTEDEQQAREYSNLKYFRYISRFNFSSS